MVQGSLQQLREELVQRRRQVLLELLHHAVELGHRTERQRRRQLRVHEVVARILAAVENRMQPAHAVLEQDAAVGGRVDLAADAPAQRLERLELDELLLGQQLVQRKVHGRARRVDEVGTLVDVVVVAHVGQRRHVNVENAVDVVEVDGHDGHGVVLEARKGEHALVPAELVVLGVQQNHAAVAQHRVLPPQLGTVHVVAADLLLRRLPRRTAELARANVDRHGPAGLLADERDWHLGQQEHEIDRGPGAGAVHGRRIRRVVRRAVQQYAVLREAHALELVPVVEGLDALALRELHARTVLRQAGAEHRRQRTRQTRRVRNQARDDGVDLAVPVHLGQHQKARVRAPQRRRRLDEERIRIGLVPEGLRAEHAVLHGLVAERQYNVAVKDLALRVVQLRVRVESQQLVEVRSQDQRRAVRAVDANALGSGLGPCTNLVHEQIPRLLATVVEQYTVVPLVLESIRAQAHVRHALLVERMARQEAILAVRTLHTQACRSIDHELHASTIRLLHQTMECLFASRRCTATQHCNNKCQSLAPATLSTNTIDVPRLGLARSIGANGWPKPKLARSNAPIT